MRSGWNPAVAANVDVVAVDGELVLGEESSDELNDLPETLGPPPCGVERHTDLVVLGLHPAGAEPELQASIGEKVDGSRLLHQNCGNVVVDAGHTGANLEPLRDRSGHGQCRYDSETPDAAEQGRP